MRLHAPVITSLIMLMPSLVTAQSEGPVHDSALAAILQRRFTDSSDTETVTLQHKVVYLVEVRGPGTPVFRDPRRGGEDAFVLPIAPGEDTLLRRFHVYPYLTGAYILRLAAMPAGAIANLSLYRDSGETRRVVMQDIHFISVGVSVGAGVHSGYQIDPNLPSQVQPVPAGSPKGGTDWSASLIAEVGDRLSVGVGLEEQSFVGPIFSVHWGFAEGRVRLVSGHLLARHRTDLLVALRCSETSGVGPDQVNPTQLSYGLYVSQQLTEASRGWSAYLTWQHDHLNHTPESSQRSSDRFMGGVAWLW